MTILQIFHTRFEREVLLDTCAHCTMKYTSPKDKAKPFGLVIIFCLLGEIALVFQSETSPLQVVLNFPNLSQGTVGGTVLILNIERKGVWALPPAGLTPACT